MQNKKKQISSIMNEYGSQKTPFLFVINFDLTKFFICPLKDIEKTAISYKIGSINNFSNVFLENKKLLFIKKSIIPYDEYLKSFEIVQENLKKGNSYLLNLTFKNQIVSNLGLQEIFLLASAKYKLFFNDDFIVFSPETFVKINYGKICSYPMKGTIRADDKNAHKKIINNKKELAEHTTIVDLIRNDLSRVSQEVRVKKFRYLTKIKTTFGDLLQVSSSIEGLLPSNYNTMLGDIICAMLPAGSISGAPKQKTLEIIKQAEISNRGYYTGIFGVFDGLNLDSAVMIRFIEKKQSKLFFRSGGGITIYSDPKKEYQEMIDKIYVPIF